MTRPLQPCGTNGAYQRHVLAGETPCDACEQAHQASQESYQKLYREDMRRRTPAGRATEILRRRHLDEYLAILAQETVPHQPTSGEGDRA